MIQRHALVAAIAVYVAVQLIAAVWPVLLLILGIGALLAAGLALSGRRRAGNQRHAQRSHGKYLQTTGAARC